MFSNLACLVVLRVVRILHPLAVVLYAISTLSDSTTPEFPQELSPSRESRRHRQLRGSQVVGPRKSVKFCVKPATKLLWSSGWWALRVVQSTQLMEHLLAHVVGNKEHLVPSAVQITILFKHLLPLVVQTTQIIEHLLPSVVQIMTCLRTWSHCCPYYITVWVTLAVYGLLLLEHSMPYVV